MMAGQLQVSMQTVGLGFSRKSHHAGITARGIGSVRNTPGPAGLTCGKERRAGIQYDRRYKIIRRDIMKRRYVEPAKAPQSGLGDLDSFGD
jgi:hypothetical protein